MERREVKISVKNLVEFVLRGGSIDNRFGDVSRAQEGSRIHRKLQKEGGSGYRSEVFLSLATDYEEFSFVVEGRADGILEEEETVTVDEIKTTAMPLELLHEDFNRLHWAQAMCYAAIYARQNGLGEIAVRLTYYHVDTGAIKRFRRRFTLIELQEFFLDLLKKYKVWADWQSGWLRRRDASLRALSFPFPQYRKGQREMAVAVYRGIERGEILFCQAPTGIGKTLSTLFPSLKAMGEGLTEKIFYLTAKTSTRAAAQDALARLRQTGMQLKSITLIAKDKLCFLQERECNPEACEYANGHYDRVNDAILSILHGYDAVTRTVLESEAHRHKVCPFELALDLTEWCDCVVCDYNYLFDPTVSLKRFFSDGAPGGDFTFLIDEAHNLVDRSREMYSASLSKSAVMEVKRQVGKQQKQLNAHLNKINAELLTLRHNCGGEPTWVSEPALEELNRKLRNFAAYCEEWLRENRVHALHPAVLELYFQVNSYLKISELYDERFVTFVENTARELTVRQLCLDASELLHRSMKRGRASVLFSATLMPMDYFVSTLGGGEEAKKYLLPSPFDEKRLKLLVAGRVSTRYRDRAAGLDALAHYIAGAVGGRAGNYLVFFPSYQYMRQAAEAFRELCPQVHVLEQEAAMTEQDREAFLARFQEENEGTLAGFCVLGGAFSEGVDLAGGRLIGAVVVGVGLPQVGAQQDLLRDYYERQNGRGFEFAYRYPGMNKVLQAAGRVIRGEQDRGLVLLVDDRFTAPSYRALFPPHWSHWEEVRTPEALQQKALHFWADGEEAEE